MFLILRVRPPSDGDQKFDGRILNPHFSDEFFEVLEVDVEPGVVRDDAVVGGVEDGERVEDVGAEGRVDVSHLELGFAWGQVKK